MAVAEVERDQDEARMLRVGQDILRPHTTEGRKIAHVAGGQVDREKVVDLVAAIILQVENVFSVSGPGVPEDGAMGFVGDRLSVSPRNGIRPYVEHTILIRRKPGDL